MRACASGPLCVDGASGAFGELVALTCEVGPTGVL